MVKGTDKIDSLYDYFTIYWSVYDKDSFVDEGKCLTFTIAHEYGDKSPTFDDILKLAKEHGYEENSGTLHLIADSPLKGKAYCYGNYGKEWYECGTTIGYA